MKCLFIIWHQVFSILQKMHLDEQDYNARLIKAINELFPFKFLIHVRPSPTIKWKKDGELIQHEESSFKISESFYGRRLSIQNVDKELHEGTYTCEAQNDLNAEKPLSFNFRLNVEGMRVRNFPQSPKKTL